MNAKNRMAMGNNMYLGSQKAHFKAKEVQGETVSLNEETFYKISNVDHMRPFFMSLVSDSNHWMFISSNGGLTAGRKDADHALFPYYTDDKITESHEITGSKTLLKAHKSNATFLWEPFSDACKGIYRLTRNLYKNSIGNKIVFEEINHDLNLSYSYEWNSSNRFGFVRKSRLMNLGKESLQIQVLDGVQNVMPSGLSSDFQNSRSNLADAYKKCELEEDIGLGIYVLSSVIVDKAEPSEALKATLIWSHGLENPSYLLSSLQLDDFRKGQPIKSETSIKAEKGAYFIHSNMELGPKEEKSWMIIAEVNQSVVQLHTLASMIREDKELSGKLEKDISAGTNHLIELTAAADGLQLTNDQLQNTRHFSNTLFNIMRGGVFDHNYQIEKKDFMTYLSRANVKVFAERADLLNQLPERFSLSALREMVWEHKDNDLKRLCLEYLPLKFSRRHGDPSRPWNKFSINTRSEIDGSKILDYEGNWRDIFQNWEALAHAYPDFMENMIHKFLNATTFEGYNPYRVTKDGFDWEVIEPNDPWSFIGYWGDHQLIYLLKFLEFIEDHSPEALKRYLNENIFVYANVPYKIKSYHEMLDHPKDTIDFDGVLDESIRNKKREFGADGALITDRNGLIYRVNLIEKLLSTVLSKISNFIPGGGIWMNTQRPEWNDANNALVGNGISMVTLFYLKRFINFFDTFVSDIEFEEIKLSAELARFFEETHTAFDQNKYILNDKIDDITRKKVIDELGGAASRYRKDIYRNGFSSEKTSISITQISGFFKLTQKYLDHTIASNRRLDGMFHSYNLISLLSSEKIEISRLPVMLEGQVAALSSGYLSASQALELLDALRLSPLYRSDQCSYMLYPDKELPRFTEKNNIPKAAVQNSTLLKRLLINNDTSIIEKDVNGDCHFNGNFNNAGSLEKALMKLPGETYGKLVNREKEKVLELFEEIFDHKSFTGRSGTFFGYEGLGSIYWHMVSKLLLAVQENYSLSIGKGDDRELSHKIQDHFQEIKEGIGVHKEPKLYGAIPTDPYSHTPATKGAQQPGMTGQVKEDILSRISELGVSVQNGTISFEPFLLKKEEFLLESKPFAYVPVEGGLDDLEVGENELVFTYCQVPVVYKLSDRERIKICFQDGKTRTFDELKMDHGSSLELFGRSGKIKKLVVDIPIDGPYLS